MSSQTSLVAKQCRLQTWALQIQECQNRPKDMSVDDWCLQHNITKTNYYYRLRRVREACLEQVQDVAGTAFVELPAPNTNPSEKTEDPVPETSDSIVPVIRLRNARGLSAEIFSSVSIEMFCHLIEAFNNAQ